MPSILVDGKEINLPRLKFKDLKRAWPRVVEIQNAEDPVQMAEAAMFIISLSTVRENPEYTQDWLEENMDAGESKALAEKVFEVLGDSGLIEKGKTMGEAVAALVAAAPVSLSTETSTASSPSLSPPDAAAAIGTG